MKKMSLQKLATIVSSFTAFLLVSMKMFFGLLSGSIAVLSSAIDSLLDMFVSIFNYFAVKNAEKPADKNFNYGRGKIEPLAGLFEWIIIFLSGGYILYQSFLKLILKEEVSYIWISVLVMAISFFITLALVYFLEYVAKKTKNLVIESDALHYKTDLFSTGWVLISLAIIYFTSWYFVDALVGIFIALYIMYSSTEIIKKWFLWILDVALEKNQVDEIIQIIENNPEVNSFHYLKTRRSGNEKFVDVHLVFTPFIELLYAHNEADKIIAEIKKVDTDSIWHVNIHMDPYDDSAEHQQACNINVR